MVTMVADCSEEAVVKQFVLLYGVARKFSSLDTLVTGQRTLSIEACY